MSIYLKIDKNYTSLGEEFLEIRRKKFYNEVAKQLPYVIVGTIQKGISPVQGFGRFQQYSKSYIDQIEGRKRTVYGVARGKTSKNIEKIGAKSSLKVKKFSLFTGQKGLGHGKLKSPVNLTVTGVMLGTLIGEVFSFGTILRFTSDIAKYHNGQGRVDRHILPKNGEQFSSLIMKKLRDILNEAFNN